MTCARRGTEKPVDYVSETSDYTGDEAEDVQSDLYELRFCENPGCGNPLPLDRPGGYVYLFGQRILVCEHCETDLK